MGNKLSSNNNTNYILDVYRSHISITADDSGMPSHDKLKDREVVALTALLIANGILFILFREQFLEWVNKYGNLDSMDAAFYSIFILFVLSAPGAGIILSTFFYLQNKKENLTRRKILRAEDFGKTEWSEEDIEAFKNMSDHPEVIEDMIVIADHTSEETIDQSREILAIMKQTMKDEKFIYQKSLTDQIYDLNRSYSYQIEALKELQG